MTQSKWTVHPEFVEPFYLEFMDGNITRSEPAQRQRLFAAFRVCAANIKDSELQHMLADSWRPAKVAAWHVAYGMRVEFLPEICARLISQPSYAEHFCFCLARLGGSQAREALIAYLKGCANGSLQSSVLDESVTPHYALAALEYAFPDESVGAPLWQAFLTRQQPGLQDHWQRRLASARDTMRTVQSYFSETLHD